MKKKLAFLISKVRNILRQIERKEPKIYKIREYK